MSALPFVKMEASGNDYVYLDAGLTPYGADLGLLPPLETLAPRISDRHTGVGSDGVILISPGATAPVAMRMWNADGSPGRICLNGLRCVARYAAERVSGIGTSFVVETGAGPRAVTVFRNEQGEVGEVEVEAGTPAYRREAIPARGEGEELWGEPFSVPGGTVTGYGLSVGNPHLVLWMEDETALGEAPLESIGSQLSEDPMFPQGVNVHLAATRRSGGLATRPWERGSGMTRACGSGAAAVFAVARRLERVEPQAVVAMPGGEVTLQESTGGSLLLRGPAREVFRGVWPG